MIHMANEGNKVFKKITNDDIYSKIVSIETHIVDTTVKVEKHGVSIDRLWWAVGILVTLTVGIVGAIAALK